MSIGLIRSMQCLRQIKEGRCNVNNKGKEKISSIPGSIYLPRKRFPTKQKYQQETAEREKDNPKDSLKQTKEQIRGFEEDKLQCSFSLQKYSFTDCTMTFTFRGRKGTLHAVVVKKAQMSWWQSEKLGGADNTVTGFRQEKAQDSSS